MTLTLCNNTSCKNVNEPERPPPRSGWWRCTLPTPGARASSALEEKDVDVQLPYGGWAGGSGLGEPLRGARAPQAEQAGPGWAREPHRSWGTPAAPWP